MTQANRLNSNDLSWFSDVLTGTAEDLSADLPVLIQQYQDLIDENASSTQIQVAKEEIEKVKHRINSCITQSTEISLNAVIDILLDTDIKNARVALECTNLKLQLALDKLKGKKNLLLIVDRIIDIGVTIATATTSISSGMGFASIGGIVDSIDQAVKIELEQTLIPDELEKIKAVINKECSKG